MSRNEGCHPGDRQHKLSSDHSGVLDCVDNIKGAMDARSWHTDSLSDVSFVQIPQYYRHRML